MNTITHTAPTSRQTFALFCATGMDWREKNLTQEQVSKMLTACQAVRGNKPAAKVICEKILNGEEIGELPKAISFQDIYNEAHAAGKAAADACKPVPMLIEGYAPIMGGVCGFAWVVLPDARKPFAKWMVQQGHARKGYSKGVEMFAGFEIGNQSLTIKEHYCAAFANVLCKHGITATMRSNID